MSRTWAGTPAAACIALLGLVALFSGCNMPLSRYPLSTSADSIEMPELPGKWSVLERRTLAGDEPTPEPSDKQFVEIKQHPEAKNLYLIKNLKDDGGVEQLTIAFCKIGDLTCLTLPMKSEFSQILVDPTTLAKSDAAIAKQLEEVPKSDVEAHLKPFSRYSIWCIEQDEANQMRWFLIDVDQVVEAIQKGDLRGTVHQPPPPADDPNAEPDRSKRIVQIQANSAELRALIKKHGRALFGSGDEHLRFTREK